MRPKLMLQKILSDCQGKIHGAHLNFLAVAVDALGRGAHLTCASLGRYLRTSTTTKHNIKRVNYMLGSTCFQQTRESIYQTLGKLLVSAHARPIIAVDWSTTTPCRTFHILRASLIVKSSGRALTLYEENHPEADLATNAVHARFMARLARCLPDTCRPIILTDAGFKTPWFKLITCYGWDYIGRVRGRTYFRKLTDDDPWTPCNALYPKATSRGKYLGCLALTKKHAWPCHAYLVHKTLKGRKKKTLKGFDDAGSASRKIAKRQREPWLLVSSLPGSDTMLRNVIACYAKRMHIEEAFRDTKSTRYGMGLKYSRTQSAQRFDALLLIATLTHLIMYLIGYHAAPEKVWQLQANTIRSRRVLSHVFVGLTLWAQNKVPRISLPIKNLLHDLAIEANWAFDNL